MRWYPYMKGGSYRRWYGNQEYVVNWQNDGREIKNLIGENGRVASRPQNLDYYFKEGLTWSDLSAKGFGVRYLPPGFAFDIKGSSGFPSNDIRLSVLAIMNSFWMDYALALLNPTVSFQVGDIARVPFCKPIGEQKNYLEKLAINAIYLRMWESKVLETTFEFTNPLDWNKGLNKWLEVQNKLSDLENHINNEVYRLYDICEEDRKAIKAELSMDEISDVDDQLSVTEEIEQIGAAITRVELAIQWIAYAIGVVLHRYSVGIHQKLGNALYHQKSFFIGSLPSPDVSVFDSLVGIPEQFAYIETNGWRHIFTSEVEGKLQSLGDMDGIAPLDDGHPDDLVRKVYTALELMLGEQGASEVVAAATGESHDLLLALRRFLERDFFPKYHVKQYRSRPVYWLLQSPKKLYGLYVFHERLTRDTLFIVQRQYVDRKLALTRQLLAEKRAETVRAASAQERRRLNKQAEELDELLLDLEEFAKRLKAITDRGYTPHIDDGVILNMAPLWEVIPSWSKEPKKYWDGLMNGEYDWAQMAMDYRPAQVREKCRTDKSLAIAHGHEEWYAGR